ncbi:MAG TPA: protein kinase [Kofleriaceae bacterium]|nr:protein kinase [Kofleriaceae bacterium]
MRLSVVVTVLLLAQAAAADAAPLVVGLDGPWRFRPGGADGDARIADPGLDDSGWEVRQVPGAIPEGGWWRRRVAVAGLGGDEPLAVLFPAGYEAILGYELYADGVRIGEIGAPGSPLSPVVAAATYRIPAGLADDGEVVLALRLGGPGPLVGGWELGRESAIEADAARALLAAHHSVAFDPVAAGFFLFVMIYHLELFRRRRSARAYLWFGLICAGALTVNVTGIASALPPAAAPYIVLYGANTVGAAVTIWALLRFTWAVIDETPPRALRLFGWLILALAVAAVVVLPLKPAVNASLAAGVLVAGARIVVSARRGHPEARVIAFGMALFAGLLAVTIVDDATVHVLPNSVAVGAFALLLLSMAFSLSQRVARSYRELDTLAAELRRQVTERARELSHALASQRGPRTWTPGVVVDGRYRVVSLLGEGGMGAVYEVERLADGKRLALKRLHEVGGPEAQARLAREAHVAARLDHPNLVPVVDIGMTSGGLYLIMELVEGASLEAFRHRFGDARFALEILPQVAAGLAFIHAEGFIHRDLKPSNVLLDGAQPRAARITDFGIAGLLRPAPDGDPDATTQKATHIDALGETGIVTLTATGAIFGTPGYMAPEQVIGPRAAVPASDVFSLGVIAHEMLTGAAPYRPPAALECLVGRQPAAPPSLRAVAGLDADVAGLLDRCVHLQPELRPSAAEVAEALSRPAGRARPGGA